jgi:hypothetical protein
MSGAVGERTRMLGHLYAAILLLRLRANEAAFSSNSLQDFLQGHCTAIPAQCLPALRDQAQTFTAFERDAAVVI